MQRGTATTEYLGKLTMTVTVDKWGKIDVKHLTEFAPQLQKKLDSMSEPYKRRAIKLRRATGHAAAQFFIFVRNPDTKEKICG